MDCQYRLLNPAATRKPRQPVMADGALFGYGWITVWVVIGWGRVCRRDGEREARRTDRDFGGGSGSDLAMAQTALVRPRRFPCPALWAVLPYLVDQLPIASVDVKHHPREAHRAWVRC